MKETRVYSLPLFLNLQVCQNLKSCPALAVDVYMNSTPTIVCKVDCRFQTAQMMMLNLLPCPHRPSESGLTSVQTIRRYDHFYDPLEESAMLPIRVARTVATERTTRVANRSLVSIYNLRRPWSFPNVEHIFLIVKHKKPVPADRNVANCSAL